MTNRYKASTVNNTHYTHRTDLHSKARFAIPANMSSRHQKGWRDEQREVPDVRGLKIWVAVRCIGDTRIIQTRRRTGGFRDVGGIYATILTSESLRSIRPLDNPGQGYWDPTHQIHVEGIHYAEEDQIRPSQVVDLSRALGPFHNDVCSAINEGDILIGPAYPRKGAIGDTQICVSGGVKPRETIIDAASREVQEELGFLARIEDSGIPPRIVRGVKHHLLWAFTREAE